MRFALYAIAALAATAFAQSRDTNPHTSPRDAAEGRRLYARYCVFCHGMDGASGRGAKLASTYRKHGSSDVDIYRTILNGVPGTEMSGHWLEEDEVWRIVTFVRELEKNAAGATAGCAAGPGDAGRGAALFRGKSACASCHDRARLGPDLSSIGATHTREHLRESIVDANRQVAPRYRAVTVRPKTGSPVRGLMLKQDQYTVHIMTAAQRIESFQRSNLAEVAVSPESLMPSYGRALTAGEIDDLAAYLCSLRGASPKGPVEAPTRELLDADKSPHNWLMYSGNYQSHRHSALRDITTANVANLELKWIFQTKVVEKFEATPIVVDGVMYVSSPPNDVFALDAATGVKLWEYKRRMPPKAQVCCGQVNRGLAVLGDRLFMGTVDAHVIALDRKSGQVLWDTKMIDYQPGYSVTHAPLVVKDKVIVGVAGGEYGVRGFLDAYDAVTGERKWRFYLTPGPGEPGNETWEGDSWKTGGASIWITGSYDPESNLTYWGTGNPGPDWNGDVRKGDNLFSCSVVALDADTGQRKWHFQFTPHDEHDWDATQIMVLIDREFRGRQRKLLINANRNGFYYVLDRLTGEFLHGKAYVKQTWAKGLDDHGRPIRLPNTFPTAGGVHVYPQVAGGTNWMSPAFNPGTGLFYVPVREGGSLYFKGEADYKPGRRFQGGFFNNERVSHDWYGAVRALDPLTGNMKWEHRLGVPPWAGLLSTGGGVIFAGTEDGYFKALDARSGGDLWHANLGGRVIANPMSFAVGGRQRIAIAAGSALFVYGLR
ncbi:MAG: PQQ-dependent dehydrogenase, methanol/ethanol family [Acidobacteria bacterium]|nr:PQQ-dependent dehydrogenase, methanol/ethanol family [Acidobacteriota bacterium]